MKPLVLLLCSILSASASLTVKGRYSDISWTTVGGVRVGSFGAAGGLEISRTNLLIEWAMTEGAGSTLSNSAASFPVATSLLPASENKYTVGKWMAGWTTGSPTVTDGYATDPFDRTNNATRWQASAGADSRSGTSFVKTDSGQYTLSSYFKSNAATNQTARIGYYNDIDNIWHYSSDFTVTPTWQRFSYTFTPGVSSNNYILYVVNGSSGAPADYLIFGSQLEPGDSASAYISNTNWFANLGKFRQTNSLSPNWTNFGLHFPSGSTRFAGAFGTTTMSNATVYVAFRRVGALNLGRFAPLLGDLFGPGKLYLAADNNSGKARFSFNGVSVYGDNGWSDGVWHLATGVADGTNRLIYLDGVLLQTAIASAGQTTVNDLNLGMAADTAYFAGDMAYALVYTNAHSSTEVAATLLAISNKLAARSVTIQHLPYYIAAEGDSRTIKDDSYIRQSLSNITANAHARIFAVSGNSLSVITNRAGQVDATFGAGSITNILTILTGVNDFGDNPTNIFNKLKTYCTARRAAGWKVICCTEISSLQTGWETNRYTLSSLIRSDNSFYDALADFEATPLGTNGAYASDLFDDGLRPSNKGNLILSTNILIELQKFIP